MYAPSTGPAGSDVVVGGTVDVVVVVVEVVVVDVVVVDVVVVDEVVLVVVGIVVDDVGAVVVDVDEDDVGAVVVDVVVAPVVVPAGVYEPGVRLVPGSPGSGVPA